VHQERFEERRRDTAGPRPIGSVIARLFAGRGYDREQTAGRLESAWESVVPPAFRNRSRAGCVRRGVLEVVVSHSALVQEMGFHKEEMIRKLGEVVPAEGIADIRCRVGDVS
jgi:hypothetical protein